VSDYRMIVTVDAEPGELLDIGRRIKEMLGDVAICTFEETYFRAFWKPLLPPPRQHSSVFEAEHQAPRTPYREK
jgi:hypothetical protein